MPRSSSSKIVVVGCGRWLRRDDQVGLLVARRLSEAGLLDARIVETESPGGDLPVELEGADLLVVVDAARPGKTTAPGAWSRIDYRREADRIVSRPSMIDVCRSANDFRSTTISSEMA